MKFDFLMGLALISLLSGVILALSFHISFWPFELIVSFARILVWLLFAVVVLCFVVLFIKGSLLSHQLAALLVVVSGLLSAYCIGFSLSVQPFAKIEAGTNKAKITFTTFNREFSNDDIKPATNYLVSQNVDVLALQEVNPTVTNQISKHINMPHYYNANRLNMVQGTSTAIVSRYPIDRADTLLLSDKSSLVRAEINIPGNGKLAFYSLHLTGPFSPNHYASRKVDSDTVIAMLKQEKLPFVLGGDFNTTVYSPSLQKFNANLNHKVQPTTISKQPECSRFGMFGLLCLRIDHVYIPPNAHVLSTYISPNLGSDHRAVTVELEL